MMTKSDFWGGEYIEMKVAIVAKTFSKGGAASGIVQLASALEEIGLDVRRYDGVEIAAANGLAPIRAMERIFEKIIFGNDAHCVRFGPVSVDLSEILENFGPDLIQLGDISGNTISLEQTLEIDVPIVHRLSDFWPYRGAFHYSSNSGEKRRFEKFSRKLMRSVMKSKSFTPDGIVAPSSWILEELEQFLPADSKVSVIRNAVSAPSSNEQHLLQPDGPGVRVGFISNPVLDERKGFESAWPLIEYGIRGGNIRSVEIFGDYSKFPKEWLSSGLVNLHGKYQKNELDYVFSCFDVLLCPSREDNSPNVVCEALVRGRPVIGQYNTGTKSYIQDDVTGILFDFFDHSESNLFEFMRSLAKIEGQYHNLSRSASFFAASNLSYQRIGLEYFNFYDSLLGAVDVHGVE